MTPPQPGGRAGRVRRRRRRPALPGPDRRPRDRPGAGPADLARRTGDRRADPAGLRGRGLGDAGFEPVLATSGVVDAADQVAVAGARRRACEPRGALLPGADPDRAAAGPAGVRRCAWRPVSSSRPTGSREAVTLPDDPGATRQSPVAARSATSSSSTAPVAQARLYVTSLGLHQVAINGQPRQRGPARAGLDALSAPPARRDLRRHRPARGGRRTSSSAALGDGWYRGRLGWDCRRRPGTVRTGGRARRPARDRARRTGRVRRVATDRDWLASTGEIRSADLYDGAVDRPPGVAGPAGCARVHDASGWRPRRGRPVRHGVDRAAGRATGPGRGDAAGGDDPPPGGDADARRRPEHRRVGPAARRGAGAATPSPCGTRRCSSRTARCTPASLRSAPGRPTSTSSPTTPRSSSSRRSRSTGSGTRRSRPTPRSWTPRSSPSAATRRARGHVRVAPTPA